MTTSVGKTWVAFTGKTELQWLRILKRGFRHCFVVLHDGKRWISLDPLASHTLLTVHDDIPCDFELTTWLRRQAGCRVVPTAVNHSHKKPAPVAPFTCVELVKRAIGLHKRFIFTPWQLYRHLTINRKKGEQKNGKS